MNELTIQNSNQLTNKALKANVDIIADTVNLEFTKSNWKIAKAIYAITTNELYKDDFGSATKFYKWLGMSPSNATEYKQAYSFMVKHDLIPVNKKGEPVYKDIIGTVGVANELNKLEDFDGFEKWFIEKVGKGDHSIMEYTKPEVVSMIKEWKQSLLGETAEETTEETTDNKVEPLKVGTIKTAEDAQKAINDLATHFGIHAEVIKDKETAMTAILRLMTIYGITVQDISAEILMADVEAGEELQQKTEEVEG